ncbi:MAG: N-6 DNA methylase [Candidatus Izemoplasmatales bacterium]|nr:N-6 DNA methylase [Candidatus Izemoplasmatales bacterium]
MADEKMNVQEQVKLILDIANILRGPFKEDEYQKIIIPMTICRRFECMLEATRDDVCAEIAAGRDNEIRLKKKSGYPIYNKSNLTLEKIIADPGKAHENFVHYLNSFNPLGVSIFNNLDFFKYVDLLAERKKLVQVLKRFANTDLSLEKVSSMQMGYIMEEIIRTYSENASAGDHFTPREVIKCLTRLLLAEGCEDLKVPGKIVTLADYACGTGGMLYEGLDEIKAMNETAEVELFGQDNNPWYSSIALAETIIRGQNPENIKLVENSLTEDAHSNQQMRLILMNPPFGQPWSKDKIGEEQYKKIIAENTKAGGKYIAGLPQVGDMQMLFWQLIINKLVNDNRNKNYGRAAVICNASPLFSGGAKSGESNIRKWLLEHDYVEAIIQFCPELFYNTGISIYAFIFNMKKSDKRKGKIQLINASSFSKRLTRGLGFKRNELTNEHIEEIVRLYTEFDKPENSKYVRILDKKDFYYKEVPCYQPFQRTFRISSELLENIYSAPAYKKLFDENTYNDLEDLSSKTAAQIEKIKKMLDGKKLQERIISVLSANVDEKIYKNRDEFSKHVLSLLPELQDKKTLLKAIILALSEDDDKGDKYYDRKGNLESDPELKYMEYIPFKQNNEDYFAEEVKPFISDAWLETNVDNISVGCEINFNKYFYSYSAPEKSDIILERLKKLEQEEKEIEGELYGGN